MSKIECTAVNELVDLVSRRPLDRDSGDDLLFARPAHDAHRPAKRSSPVRIVAAPTVRPMPQLRLVPASPTAPPVIHAASRDLDQTWAVTMRRRLQNATPRLVTKIALLVGLLVVTGISIGHFAFKTTHDPNKTPSITVKATPPTPPPLAMTAPVAPQPVAPALAPKPVLVDVRIDSQPAGTTVTLVDGTKSTFLGTTPVDASVDPSRTYDVVFTRDGQPSHTEHLDPKITHRLTIALDAAPQPVALAVANTPPHATAAMTKTQPHATAAMTKNKRHHTSHVVKKPAKRKPKKHA